MGNGYIAAGGTYSDDVIVKNGNLNVVDPDADTLTLTIKDPDGVTVATVVQDDLTRIGEGHYSYAWDVAADADTGPWTWRWDATVEGANLPDAVVTVVVLPAGSLITNDAYATVDQLLPLLPDDPGPGAVSYLTDLLMAATSIVAGRVDMTGQRDFFRHPSSSGTETRYLRSRGGDKIIVVGGVVSLTGIEYASELGGDFTALGAENTDWYLDDPVTTRTSDGTVITTYHSIRLPSTGALTRWYRGPRTVRATGVFGWPDIPAIIASGTLALAREMYALQPTGRGSASGGAAMGSLALPEILPRPTYEAINWGAHLVPHLFV